MNRLRIATRKSPLALWQAEEVARRLSAIHSGLNIELIKMSTRGDKILDSPLSKIGGKGLFVKELELGLLENQADIAVHSIKDIPMEFPNGLHLHTILDRDDPRDAFVSNKYKNLSELPPGAKIGTSSLRRRAQLSAHYPHLQIDELRGNVGTRLQKLDNEQYDAIILAVAGLKRLDLAHRITDYINIQTCLPAIGQAAVGIECRVDDEAIKTLIAPLNHHETAICIQAERALNQRMHGGCHVPIAAYAQLDTKSQQLHLQGLVGMPDGSRVIHDEISGSSQKAEVLGTELAENLLALGGGTILSSLGFTVPN